VGEMEFDAFNFSPPQSHYYTVQKFQVPGQQNKITFSSKEDGTLPRRSCNYMMSHVVLLLLSSILSPHFCFLWPRDCLLCIGAEAQFI